MDDNIERLRGIVSQKLWKKLAQPFIITGSHRLISKWKAVHTKGLNIVAVMARRRNISRGEMQRRIRAWVKGAEDCAGCDLSILDCKCGPHRC